MSTANGANRLTLNKVDKLRFKSQFDRLRRVGVRKAGPMLVVVMADFDQLGCAVVCGRKFSTRAVVRNRMRRLLWESFRLLKPNIKPAHLLLIPRRKMISASQQEVMSELQTLLTEHGVMSTAVAE